MMPTQQTRQQTGIACDECRRKRVRCDRVTPQCSACASSGTSCVVRDSCPRRGPKKGYLKTLQDKIEDLQAQLEKSNQVSAPISQPSPTPSGLIVADDSDWDTMALEELPKSSAMMPASITSLGQWPAALESGYPMFHLGPWDYFGSSSSATPGTADEMCPITEVAAFPMSPTLHNDLDQLFFDRVYIFAPIVQARRYRSWSSDPAKSRARTCLQHAMWTLASSRSSRSPNIDSQLYATTTQLLHALETEVLDDQIPLELAQSYILLTIYELTCVGFPRGLMTAGKAFRSVQVLRLYEVDAAQTPSSELAGRQFDFVSSAQEDWVDVETKRRTFWLAFTLDRFTSIIDGLHLFFDERMIRTRIPAPENNFASGRPKEMSFAVDMASYVDWQFPDTDATCFTETVFQALICGKALENRQRPPINQYDTKGSDDLTYDFCRRHRTLNAVLARRISALKAQSSLEDLGPMATFAALASYMAVLMLYDIIESNPLGNKARGAQITTALRTEHQQLCSDAVADVTILIMSLTQHFQLHPLTPVLLLTGGKIVQTRPELNTAYDKLTTCIIAALEAISGANKLAQLSLQQLGCQTYPT